MYPTFKPTRDFLKWQESKFYVRLETTVSSVGP